MNDSTNAATGPRPWFRFRLSTILVLTAIAAWAMACRPYLITTTEHVVKSRLQLSGYQPIPGEEMPVAGYIGFDEARTIINSELLWPALAFAAFLAWKVGWAVVARRRTRIQPSPTFDA